MMRPLWFDGEGTNEAFWVTASALRARTSFDASYLVSSARACEELKSSLHTGYMPVT